MTEKELHKVFSANITRHRKSLHWTQSQLAKKTGVSVNFINDLENGKKWASPVNMVKLGNALKIETYELLKPYGLFPDSLSSMLRKYNEDIHTALEQTRQAFLQGAAAQKKQDRAP
ncbi:MAG: helix-turn-helix domain-containing protein [Treponema sp.]|jgi:transcriptional regulator with XRE-family HTH domain|nr:helix-turn-helix domain-containing protein [Treponema sp.]